MPQRIAKLGYFLRRVAISRDEIMSSKHAFTIYRILEGYTYLSIKFHFFEPITDTYDPTMLLDLW